MKPRLKQRLKLQSNGPTADAAGQLIEAWSTYRECWGNVRDLRGRELMRGEGVEDITDAVVTIRHPREGRIPVAEDRVIFDEGGTSRTLNIVAVRRVDEQRRWMELAVKEQP